MANEPSMALEELVRKAQMSEDVDFLREGVRALAEALMEAEVTQQLGAGRYERTPSDRGTQWQPGPALGYARRQITCGSRGSVTGVISPPAGAAPPSRACAVGGGARGVCPGGLDATGGGPRADLGLPGISKSQVSVICGELDAEA